MEDASITDLTMTSQINLLRRLEGALRYPAKIATELVEYTDRIAGGVCNDFHLPLIQKLVQTRQQQMNGAIFAFSSISPGEGVTYVIEKIALELSRHSGETVMAATAASLYGLEPAHFEGVDPEAAGYARVWRLARTYQEPRLDAGSLHPESLQLLRKRFDYVLVDCPALRESAAAFSVAAIAEGIVLVVAAGEANRDQIEQAQSALKSSSCNLLGLVLNKRTDPVPKLITKFI
jgi:hypothetical protein